MMDGGVSLLLVLSLLLAVSFSASADVCFWSGSCSNRWIGTCGFGRVKVDQSDDCQGRCPPPRYPPCHPFNTHLLCCNEETPTAGDDCARCANRVELGDYWLCCSDGTQATVTNLDNRSGFCRSGAQLSIQPKSREIFSWKFRGWSECSAVCGDGKRHREVRCVGSLEYAPKQRYYVNDTKCETPKMPLREEPCRTRPCSHEEQIHDEYKHTRKHHERHHRKHRHRIPLWARIIISALTASVTFALCFAGYILYQRWKEGNANHGFVYVMLDNYS